MGGSCYQVSAAVSLLRERLRLSLRPRGAEFVRILLHRLRAEMLLLPEGGQYHWCRHRPSRPSGAGFHAARRKLAVNGCTRSDAFATHPTISAGLIRVFFVPS